MANKKISQLTPKGSALAGTDLLEVSVFNGVTYDTKSLTGANVVSGLQPTLVSGTNIKTINSTTLLGSGDVAVQPTLVSATNIKTINSTTLLGSGDVAVQPTLVSGTSIKTINSTSLLGSGDIAISTGLTVGTTAIASGTVGSILFQGTGNVVQQDSTLFWDNTNKRLGIGATPSTSVRLDVRAQGALSTDIVQRWRNSADSANFGLLLGDGTINFGLNNYNFTSTVARVNVVGQNNGVSSYNTATYLNLFGQDNTIMSYGTHLVVGKSNTSNGNSGSGFPMIFGGTNTVAGYGMAIGHSNNISSLGTQSTMSIGVGYGNYVQYEHTNVLLFGNNLRVDGAGNTAMTKIGWSTSGGGQSQIARSFELYQNGTAGSDFFMSGKTNVVLTNNTVVVSGTHYEASATNCVTMHNGTASTASIANAFIVYSADQTAGNAAPHFRTENGSVIKLYQETTAVAAATVVSGAGGTVKHDDTFDGYTLQQVVKALRNSGLLA